MDLPIPLAAAVARAEQVAQEQWKKAEAATDRKEAFLDAVRAAYVQGIQVTLDAILGEVATAVRTGTFQRNMVTLMGGKKRR